MIGDYWLICGTRKKGYKELVFKELDKLVLTNTDYEGDCYYPASIIEGCCPDSADAYAEEWAKPHKIIIQHHPATSGNYLKRNIEMVNKCDLVIAFYDHYSYGTSQCIANAVRLGKPVIVISLKDSKW